MISGGNYHLFPSFIENSAYLPSLNLIGKVACEYRGWHKWGPLGSPADAPEPFHPTICAAGSLSLIFFLCFWVEINVTMQAGRFGEVLWDVSSALKRDDGVLSQEAWRLGFLSP